MAQDLTLEFMKAEGIPLTRENYIGINWMGDIEDPSQMLPAELEAELPAQLRHPDFNKETE